MKHILFVIAMSIIVIAKSQTPKNNLSLQAGLALPFASYANTDETDDASFATIGINMQAVYLHTVNKFYLGAQLSLFTNGFNIQAYDRNIERSFTNAISSTNGGGYAGLGISAIWGYNFYSTSATNIGGTLKIGYLGYGISEIQTTITDGTNTFKFITESSANSAITGALGLQLKNDFKPNWSFIASLDYMFARPEFREVGVKQYINGSFAGSSTIDGYVKVRNLLGVIGIGYNF